MEFYNIYITFIFILKITLIILVLSHIYFGFMTKNESTDTNVLYWKERVEFVFKILMAILLFYIFNPINEHIDMIDFETKFLFCFLGISLIISANWNEFITQSKWYSVIK